MSAVAALADDLRNTLYAFIRRQGHPVTREEAAANTGISRKLAAFHLDKLVRVGLLRARHEAPPDRVRGPGRVPKVYEPVDVEFRVSIPERRYDLVGDILVDAIASESDGDEDAWRAALRIARERGVEVGERAREERHLRRPGPERALHAAEQILERYGYEPVVEGEALLVRNCPFHRLAARQPALVCTTNRAFLDGVLRGLGNTSVEAALVPHPNRCCVELRPSPRH